ncbi:xanthine dehydrogenase accessory protein XdhC [Bermanella marisrubri]|uniref:Putative xanthine dehydrogenase accessory protein XdhC n=1 Tax=Bermanella marisrubri TaxID=207949 RepID=Q1N1R5_9GAMM|nr:xanthine dehydrogenase accessory protein XdhC [Bermanella marisrubri]EAT12216.1 putative xanthine dehydrogenase accessory protein XdhC [Oceanobacter sp. RED65] [Bermanella marisrubri]QIZ83685.1 xanthine dehydrogenase accessory protein XdhC [Bermanella marisrubri]
MRKHQRWHQAISECEQLGEAYVIATVIGTAGSIPRDIGSKMVITQQGCFDTLGGGHLEFKVIEHAQTMLKGTNALNEVQHFPLGAKLGQCCGGSVSILFEFFPVQAMQLTVFGAGHVANALMNILGGLPGKVHWVDSRAECFHADNAVAGNIEMHVLEHPQDFVADMPSNSQVLILTHNHQLDYELLELCLKRDDLAFIGCIGSQTKANRFNLRLKNKGFGEAQRNAWQCPVGDLNIPGKLPMQVAVSIASQIIKMNEKNVDLPREGVQWKELKQVMFEEQ